MPDLARLRRLLLASHPEVWVDHLLSAFRGAYFAAFDESAIARHLERMRALSESRPVSVTVEPAGAPGPWTLEVVGYDAFQFLSTLCKLLTIHGLTIDEARIFTSEIPPEPTRPVAPRRPFGFLPNVRHAGPVVTGRTRRPEAPGRRRRIVDVLRVRSIDPTMGLPNWDAFDEELVELTRLLRENRHDEVQHRLIGRFVAVLDRHHGVAQDLEPLDLTIDPHASDFATVVGVRGHDSLGFLSLTTGALALCGIQIAQADIRTAADGRVDDTLWVTDRSGRKIAGGQQVRALRLSLLLIEHFSLFLPHAADPEVALRHFSRFATETMARSDWAGKFAALDRPEVLHALVRILGDSEFLWRDYLRDQPELVLPLINDPAQWDHRVNPTGLATELDRALRRGGDNADERARALRRLRDRELFRAGLRAIVGRCTPGEFSAEMTTIGEVVLRSAFREARATAEPGPPRRLDGTPAPAILCALGKFGGRELGFGSDLELMLVYDDHDLADPLAASDHFDATVRHLRTLMGIQIGGTFELDFRLRPYGKGGPPATALAAFESYFQAGGPAWAYERQALIRLRAIAGDPELGRRVEAHRDRFVYGPEPFDPAELRRMRGLQIKQLVEPGAINAKFSPGALVDIEYFVQALQITFGGSDPTLRTPNTLEALAALEAAEKLDPVAASTLRGGYHFCRELIDALRVVRGNARDTTVPRFDSPAFATLCRRLRRADPAGLHAELQSRLDATHALVVRLADYLPTPAPASPPPL